MKSFRNNKCPELAIENECTGCLACVDSCTQNALEHFIGKDGHFHISFNEDKCIGCKTCERICYSSRNKSGSNELDKSQVYAAWSANSQDRYNATSGGVFAAVARCVFNRGGVVVGACLEGRECKHVLITESKDIERLQGSKYMSSSMAGIYRVIEKELCKHPVLFSGVGCQCAGVLAFFEKSRYRDNLITLDLVCGGAPSRILIDKFYEHYSDVERIVSFRSKDKYELKVLEKGKVKTILEKTLPLHGFNCELTNRFNCYHCQFARAHRMTDITIGDLWNYNYMPAEHENGISTVIVHTKVGKTLLDEAQILLNDLKWKDCINYCKRIVWGNGHIFEPRKNLVYNSVTMDFETFNKLYCMSMKFYDFNMMIFKIYRFCVMRKNDFKAKKYINLLIKKYEGDKKI